MPELEDEGPPADRLQLRVENDDREPCVWVDGEIDVFTAPSLAARIDEVVTDSTTSLALDLDEVSFIDSTGLRVLIEADRRMRDRGGALVLRRPSRAVSRLLELTALGEWLTVDPATVPET